jgi:hypothetical protein
MVHGRYTIIVNDLMENILDNIGILDNTVIVMDSRIMDKFEWLELMVYGSLLDNFMVLVMA